MFLSLIEVDVIIITCRWLKMTRVQSGNGFHV